ncbi:hypothetical protein WR25_24360 [Diploscapter pachys]|uniref:Uncharacterized protein n=1 Tax=Diploscapter pachys TaxID=2018661 RepID=A0A2A2M409_9BILA|nr:hypothetical protein WR25_24360 [Diploscapter pachys]
MHFIMNGSQLVVNEGLTESIPAVDSAINTAAVISRREVDTDTDVGRFRAAATIRLAQPPPALLIGVPSDAINDPVSYGVSSPILLSPSSDSRPLPVVIFAGRL